MDRCCLLHRHASQSHVHSINECNKSAGGRGGLTGVGCRVQVHKEIATAAAKYETVIKVANAFRPFRRAPARNLNNVAKAHVKYL